MVLVQKIETDFSEIISKAQTLDNYIQQKPGVWGGKYEIIPEKVDDYWSTREILEAEITSWMGNIRKAIISLPTNIKRIYRDERMDYNTSESYTEIRYDNNDYESIIGFQKEIVCSIEGHTGVLSNLSENKPIFNSLRAIRGAVLSLCRTLETLVPEIMVSIDQQVELVYKLRDKGIDEAALLIEELDQIEDNTKKCTNIRSALEKIVEAYLTEKKIKITKGFYNNLDAAIKTGFDEQKKRKSITALYSYNSKIIHKELEDNSRNTQYAVNGMLNILHGIPWIME